MRSWLVIVLFFASCGLVLAQNGDSKPKIRGQRPDPIVINEDETYTVQLTNLVVRDRDDWFYPFGFTMKLYPGENYTLDGNRIIPTPNHFGKLEVPVTVNDGEQDSESYNLKIDVKPVNDIPVIQSQSAITTEQGKAVTLSPSQLVITDPDDTQFTLQISNGSNYTVNGNTITPASNFTGTLTVPIRANDGEALSSTFNMQITVIAVAATITGQTPLQTPEDTALELKLSHLIIQDPRNRFPQGYVLNIIEGNNYSFVGTKVTPAQDFNGNLVVSVLVTDGERNSNTYPLRINVIPVNDAPTIADLEEMPIVFEPGASPFQLSQSISVTDPDHDSLTFVEVGFDLATYRHSIDKLTVDLVPGITGTFNPDQGKIKLTGIAEKADYVEVLRSIHYETLLPDEPLMETKKIWVIASDGKLTSEPAIREIKPYSITVDLEIPTAFTPNGDQANDTWRIRALREIEEYSKAVIRIYAKNGQLLYQSIGISSEWDGTSNGKLLPADSYFYTIDFGLRYANEAVKGIVTILR